MLKKGCLLLTVILFLCFSEGLAQMLSTGSTWYNPMLEEVVELDPNTGSYFFYKLQGGKKEAIPYKILSQEEFNKFQQQEAIRKGWIEKRSSATSAQRGAQGGIIPTIRVNNEAFGTIFGGNEISINPQGSAEVIFGVNSTKTDNPMIPTQFRRSTGFDFDAKLQFNVTGKIGERLKLNFNYNTDATFDFEQEIKLEYTGDEDDIIQKIEAGNVSFPLSGTLITGSQSLFGIKTELKFGKLSFTGLVSQQRSQSKEILVQGGAQSRNFELQIDSYDANRHFFLSQVFHDNYDKSLRNLPLIQSGINITKVEVWVTNKTNRFDDSRSIVAFTDLGEPTVLQDPTLGIGVPPPYPEDAANSLFTTKVNKDDIRNINNVTSYLTGLGYEGARNYEKLENARKLQLGTDYTVNAELGYISLSSALNYDEVLAVAFEYTVNGITKKVGELSTDGVISPNALSVKLLKGTNQSPSLVLWRLMMKNVYSLDAYQLSKENFVLDVYYEDSQAGTELPYISEGNISNKPLIQVLNLDNLNSQNDPHPDGVFDFVNNVTVIASQGAIIFPAVEPFGSYLASKIGNPAIASKYVYQELYDSTLTKAREVAEKNKFKLMGSYQSEIASEIYLNAVNIPEGSVIVTAGSMKLVENVDYIVNYTMGTVRIINPGYLESSVPIKVSVEDRGLFNIIQKTMYGAHMNYQVNKDFNIGATFLGLHERPLTTKASFGNDPMSNMMWGVNASYRTESRWLTKMVDKLPFIETKAPSTISVDAEFAQLIPGQSSSVSGKTFVDDFDGTQTAMDLRSVLAWNLASTPQGMFAEAMNSNDIKYGFRRSKFAWYSVSIDFLRSTQATPSYIRSNPTKYRNNHFVREISVKEIYPNRDIITGSPTYIPTLSWAFYPTVRGPYNYQTSFGKINTDGLFTNPKEQWGGIMRSLPETDFETANYEYIEFWLMDPFVYNPNAEGGDLYINLGDVSEDILKDGYKQYENGLPYPYDAEKIIETAWGHVPKAQSLVYTFDNNYSARSLQDVGFDGLNDEAEREFFETKYGYISTLQGYLTTEAFQKILADPSSDNYRYFFDSYYTQHESGILDCYSDFNGPEGNSKAAEQTGGTGTMANPNPDVEDINKDNTMNETERFYQYRVRINPQNLVVGQNFIVDRRTVTVENDNEGTPTVNWYLFKIPITDYEKTQGDISDFKSIRFMRMFMTGFSDTTYMRFASLDLVRSEWRKYNYSMIEGQEGLAQPELANALFDISVVNIEENANRTPVNYVLPPGTTREIDASTYQGNQLNEQSMQLKVVALDDGEARAAYKSSLFDFRRFRRLQMDIHAESVEFMPTLHDGDVTLFVRLGSDYRNNYYEYEIPLAVTPPGSYTDNQRTIVWPEENLLDLELEKLTDLKLERNQYIKYSGGSVGTVYEKNDGDRRMRIVGNPNLGSIRNVMIGIRNPAKTVLGNDDGQAKSAIVWVDEMRLTDVDNKSGWAANARASATLADLGTVTVSGNMKTAGFGGIESRINDRINYDSYQYDIITNFELGKFFPDKLGVHVPMFFGFSEYFETPFYNPYDQDVKMSRALDMLDSKSQQDSLKSLTQTYTRRKAFSLNNVRMAPNGGVQRVFDISNLSLSYSFSESSMRNMRTVQNLKKNFNGGLAYTYSVQTKYFEPFKKIGGGKALGLIRDFNIGLYPKQFSFTTDMSRYYGAVQVRNVAYPDITIPATYAKDFLWNRSYILSWDLARSLNVNFSASNLARIDEPDGMVNRKEDPNGYRHWRDSVWSNITSFGRNVEYRQELNATWQVPLGKIPALNWISLSTSYRAGYEWVAAPVMREGETYDPGNIISNKQNYMIAPTLNFTQLYSKFSYLRYVNNRFNTGQRKDYGTKEVTYQAPLANFFAKRKRIIKHGLRTEDVTIKVYGSDNALLSPQTRVVDKNNVEVTFDENVTRAKVVVVGQVPKPQSPLEFTGELLLRMAMSVQNIGLTYEEDNSSTLPGFKPGSVIFGQSNYNGSQAPGLGFVFGKQDHNFVNEARNKGWLTQDPTFISPYIMSHTQRITGRADLEVIRDLKINLVASRTYNTNETMYSVVNPNGEMQAMGRFSISIISIGSAFESPNADNEYRSKSYQSFLNKRPEVAWLYANNRAANHYSQAYNPGTGAYPDGYGEYNPDVLRGSFLAAYAGKSVSKGLFDNFPSIPLPNWNISYTGLSRIPALQKIFRSANIQHSYTSTYNISTFSLNSLYTPEGDGFSYVRNTLSDFIPERDLTNISIDESLSPLLQVDLSFQNNLMLNLGTNRIRRVALSLSNNQITEMRNKEYIVGAGFLFNNVPLLFNIDRRSSARTTTKLALKADFMYRDELNIIRRLDESTTAGDVNARSQIADGRNVMSIKFTADYTISDKVNMRLFFDRMLTKPYVSAIGTTNTNFGISVKVMFTQ